jgi:hypothetical protein
MKRRTTSSGKVGRPACSSVRLSALPRSAAVSHSVPSRSNPTIENGKSVMCAGSAHPFWKLQALAGKDAGMTTHTPSPSAAAPLALVAAGKAPA